MAVVDIKYVSVGLCRIFQNVNIIRPSYFIPRRTSFYEPHRAGHDRYLREDNRPVTEKIRHGMSLMKGEIKMWKEEVKEFMALDPKRYSPGDTDIIWNFNDQKDLDKWISTSDSDNNEGYSQCEFTLSKHRKGLFRGILSTEVPKDGLLKRSGYCNVSAMKHRKSFMRDAYLDWSVFTHLEMRIRGDGRNYMINLLTSGDFDVTWHDIYNFVLHTRGGPYWQTVKLPFSRFYLSSKGIIQDKQARVPLDNITSLGITCGDSIPGPFQLEIDYIGVHLDGNFKEKFAYEMYTFGKNLLH